MKTSIVFCSVLWSCCFLPNINVYGSSIDKHANFLLVAVKKGKADSLVNNFVAKFEYNAINKIFAKAIKESFKNFSLYGLMLDALLELGYSYRRTHYDPKYGHNFMISYATNLYKMRHHTFYRKLKDSKRTEAYRMWVTLLQVPEQLFYEKEFYLRNVQENKFIYTGFKTPYEKKVTNNNIWLWYDSNSIDDTSRLRLKFLAFNDGTKFKVALIGAAYDMYYVIGNMERHYVQGWNEENPERHIWTIEFLDYDLVAFTQQNYIMCAVEKADDYRQNVAAPKIGSDYSAKKAACQWRLVQK